jgi:hypothetical protein
VSDVTNGWTHRREGGNSSLDNKKVSVGRLFCLLEKCQREEDKDRIAIAVVTSFGQRKFSWCPNDIT